MSIFGLIQLPGGAGALGIDHPNGGTIYNPGHVLLKEETVVIVFESVLPVYLVNLGREAMKNWFASCTEAELRNLASLGSVKNICVSRSWGQVNPAENQKEVGFGLVWTTLWAQVVKVTHVFGPQHIQHHSEMPGLSMDLVVCAGM